MLGRGIEDVGRPAIDSNDCNCTEDGPDGLADLTLKFKTQDIVEAIGDVNYGDTVTLKLTGVVIGERPKPEDGGQFKLRILDCGLQI